MVNLLMLNGLENEAATVRTAVFDKIADRLQIATSVSGTLLVTGEHGSGKRFAVLTCVAEQRLPDHHVIVPVSASSKDMVRAMYEAVTGEDDVFALRDMQDALVESLAEQPRIVVIDGVDQLTAQAAAQLNYLHRQPGAQWSMVLVGPTESMRAIRTSAALRGEILSWVEVPPLRGKDLLTAVGSLHPLFLLADADLILRIDEQVCKGLIKNWARFLQIALQLRQRRTDAGLEPEDFNVLFVKDVIGRLPMLPSPKRR